MTSPHDLTVHAPFLRRLALHLLRSQDLADDAVQETLLLAWRQKARPNRKWLAGVLRNVARNQRRTEVRREARLARWQIRQQGDQQRQHLRTPEAIREREATRQHLLNALLALPEPVRDVMLMRFDEGLPPRRIAAALGVPVHTVHNRVRRGLALMRRTLRDVHEREGRSWRGALGALVPTLTRAAAMSAPLGGMLMWKPVVAAAGVVALLGLGVQAMLQSDLSPTEADPVPAANLPLSEEAGGNASRDVVLAGAGPTASPAPHTSAAEGVHGRVRERASGAPVAGALVTLTRYADHRVATTTTNGEGAFTFADARQACPTCFASNTPTSRCTKKAAYVAVPRRWTSTWRRPKPARTRGRCLGCPSHRLPPSRRDAAMVMQGPRACPLRCWPRVPPTRSPSPPRWPPRAMAASN